LDKMNERFEQILDTYTKDIPKVLPFQKPSVNVEKMKLPKLNKIS